MTRRTIGIVTLLALAGIAPAASITLTYNDFNPGASASACNSSGVALDTDNSPTPGGSSTFDIGSYTGIVYFDLNLSDSVTSGSRFPIAVNWDGSQVTGVYTGENRISGDPTGSTNVALNTLKVYVESGDYHPTDMSGSGYVVQTDYGVSGRTTLAAGGTPTYGDTTITLVNDVAYALNWGTNYTGEQALFSTSGGTIATSTTNGMKNEGSTIEYDSQTWQLADLNVQNYKVDMNGLSFALAIYPRENDQFYGVPAESNSTYELIAGATDKPTAPIYYRLPVARATEIRFNTTEDGNTVTSDIRVESTTGGITLRTMGVAVETTSDSYTLQAKAAPNNTNGTTLLTGLAGDVDLTLLPILDANVAVYFLTEDGASRTDPRYSWRLDYDDVAETWELVTWSDAAGTVEVRGQSITLENGTVLTLVPEPMTMALLGTGALALVRRRRR